MYECPFLTGLLPYTASALKVTPTAPDKKNVVKVNGQDPGPEVNLNVGDTAVEIEVTSGDGSNKQVRVCLDVYLLPGSTLIFLLIEFTIISH